MEHVVPPQNEGVVRDHIKAIMQIIGKLGEDRNAGWPVHLAEIVHAYNAT